MLDGVRLGTRTYWRTDNPPRLKREPYWLDLAPGVGIRVRPCTTALVMAARAGMIAGGEGDDDNARGAAMLKALARVAIVDWEGIGDEAGAPIPPRAERIDALLDLYPAFRAFETAYFLAALVLDAGKKRLRARAEWHFGGGPDTAATA